MGKTFYSFNEYQFISFTTLSQWSKGFNKVYKNMNRREEMGGVQFRAGKFTTDDPDLIKALNEVAEKNNDIFTADPTAEEKERDLINNKPKSLDEELLSKAERKRKLEEIKGLL